MPWVFAFTAGWVLGRLAPRDASASRRVPEPPPRPLPDEVLAQVRALLQQRKKINAIKAYRQATGAGLKASKEAVEAIQEEMGPSR